MINFFQNIVTGIAIMFLGVAGWLGYQQQFGTVVPISIAVFETSLSSAITTASDSMTLVASSTKSGTALDGYMCFTVDGGKTNEEFICGSASSTAISALKRGIDPVNPNTTSTALSKAHRAGANVKITDWPQLGIISRIINGDDTFPNKLSYATNTLVFTSDSSQIPTIRFVETTATSGAPEASFAISGLVELATGTELTAGTATSTATRYLVAPNSFFNQTSSANTLVPVTNASGLLSPGFISTSSAYTWTGLNSFASTTFSKTISVLSGISSLATTTITGSLSVTATTTFTGTTTFEAIPTLPTATATASYQVPSKAYVDETLGVKLTGIQALTQYTGVVATSSATTTLFITAHFFSTGNNYIQLWAGLTSTTMAVINRDSTDAAGTFGSVSGFVPKNWWYSVVVSSGSSSTTVVEFGN